MYNQIEEKILFDRLYTYGPPASLILADYTLEAKGPRPMVMPRLAAMECDSAFNKRLECVDSKTQASNILLLAFPGAEYLAPLCFTSILLELARLGGQGFHPIVKFKNWRSAKSFIKQISPLDSSIRWVGSGSVESLVWDAGFALVFNSISLYEALLGPSIIIIPSFLDSLQDDNMLQETHSKIFDLVGEMQSVCFAKSVSDIERIIKNFQGCDLPKLILSERKARKKIVSNKFYLECEQGIAKL
ncbi:hypothetical protein [Chromobacterium vaccinii]|uniref:hypothetical protein n=1 Tax=Chromobacterium vaccinii TaxID=1108595 RepID=UPI0011C07B60|nr:hypothetical protein [Chromobacterium vaccinii]